MHIEILGSESLGVRGLCCFVRIPGRKVLIDPGIALGYMRHKLQPHPFQIAVEERIKRRILACWQQATDIVFSHFHGDHVPLADANPYQLHMNEVIGLNPEAMFWTKPSSAFSSLEEKRAGDLASSLGVDFISGADPSGKIEFAGPFPHGPQTSSESVIMTRIEADKVFVHASDIQLLSGEAVSRILEWSPDVALVDGPPLYLARLSEKEVNMAWENAIRLARGVDCLVLDHHLMRDRQGIEWLERLSRISGKIVMCSADFMRRPRMLLEADREDLYAQMPVPGHWHEDYSRTRGGADAYWNLARKRYACYRLDHCFPAEEDYRAK